MVAKLIPHSCMSSRRRQGSPRPGTDGASALPRDTLRGLPARHPSSTLSARSMSQRVSTSHMSEFDYDLFVIGGGSGGVRAARIAAGHGAKVAIAEEYRFGGTCVIRGCVPKKLLVYASRFRDDFEDAAGFGWSVSPPSFDWPTLIANKDAEITRLEGLYRQGLERAGVDHPARPRRAGRRAHRDRAARQPQDHGAHHPGRDRRTPGGARGAGRRARHHLQRGVPSRSPAEVHRDRRRRLHRRGVRRHLQRARRRHHAALPRPQDPARLRRGAARPPHRGAVQARHRRRRATPRSPPSTRAGRTPGDAEGRQHGRDRQGDVRHRARPQHARARPRGGRREARATRARSWSMRTRAPRSRTSTPWAT